MCTLMENENSEHRKVSVYHECGVIIVFRWMKAAYSKQRLLHRSVVMSVIISRSSTHKIHLFALTSKPKARVLTFGTVLRSATPFARQTQYMRVYPKCSDKSIYFPVPRNVGASPHSSFAFCHCRLGSWQRCYISSVNLLKGRDVNWLHFAIQV